MRTFIIIIISTLFVFKSSFAQQEDKKYTFKEVGWTLILPADFKIIDSAGNAEMNERGKKIIEEAIDTKAEISQARTLISATKNINNYFNSTIEPFEIGKDGDYDVSNQIVKDMVYKSFLVKLSDAKIDSISTNEEVDGLTFDKFHVTISIKDKILFNLFLLSKNYKGYDFSISYLYLDDKTKEQIETMLKNSRFTK